VTEKTIGMQAEETSTIEAHLVTCCVVKYLYLAILHFLVLNQQETKSNRATGYLMCDGKSIFWYAIYILLLVIKRKAKNVKTPEQDNINSELFKYAPVEFTLRLLQFLNNIYIYIEKIAFQMSGKMLL